MAILGSDLDIIISPPDIECGEERLALELFKNMGDLWYGVDVSDCPLVDLSVVLYQS
jgi:hypothetical protein